MRPIVNLRDLNNYLKVPKFLMFSLADILPTLTGICGSVSSTYRVHISTFLYTRTIENSWFKRGEQFQYADLLFGWVSLHIFIKCVSVMVVYLWVKKLIIFQYLDSRIFVGKPDLPLNPYFSVVVQTLEDLGFIINYSKSCLTPIHRDKVGFYFQSRRLDQYRN